MFLGIAIDQSEGVLSFLVALGFLVPANKPVDGIWLLNQVYKGLEAASPQYDSRNGALGRHIPAQAPPTDSSGLVPNMQAIVRSSAPDCHRTEAIVSIADELEHRTKRRIHDVPPLSAEPR
jgi:hypothetical protein